MNGTIMLLRQFGKQCEIQLIVFIRIKHADRLLPRWIRCRVTTGNNTRARRGIWKLLFQDHINS
jgi:hypothetical protein